MSPVISNLPDRDSYSYMFAGRLVHTCTFSTMIFLLNLQAAAAVTLCSGSGAGKLRVLPVVSAHWIPPLLQPAVSSAATVASKTPRDIACVCEECTHTVHKLNDKICVIYRFDLKGQGDLVKYMSGNINYVWLVKKHGRFLYKVSSCYKQLVLLITIERIVSVFLGSLHHCSKHYKRNHIYYFDPILELTKFIL